MKIRRVAFYPAAAAVLALKLSVPKLIHEGIINNDGEILLPLTCQVHDILVQLFLHQDCSSSLISFEMQNFDPMTIWKFEQVQFWSSVFICYHFTTVHLWQELPKRPNVSVGTRHAHHEN
ncbi:hypothetical protein GBA52_028593 [Prunus armeniaca]|nr:hypothetical protein GBA52_028593 [Prunus armeniaca]